MPGIVLLPDVEMAARTWLRASVTSVAGRVWFARPTSPGKPYLTVSRVGGVPDRDAPLDIPRLSIHAWGANAQQTLRVARDIVYQTRLLEDVSYTSVWVDDLQVTQRAQLIGAVVVLGPVWAPEEDRNLARHITDITLTVRPVTS